MRSEVRTIAWRGGVVEILDQRKLPHAVRYLRLKTARQVAKAIRDMAIRGAPAIGVAAAMGLALTAYRSRAKSREKLLEELRESYMVLRASRPTAVNLFWALDRVMRVAESSRAAEEARTGANSTMRLTRSLRRAATPWPTWSARGTSPGPAPRPGPASHSTATRSG